MFNDDGLGEAMALAHARDVGLAANKRSKKLETLVFELADRVAKLEREVALMRTAPKSTQT